jgi:hypothetical protein
MGLLQRGKGFVYAAVQQIADKHGSDAPNLWVAPCIVNTARFLR